MSFETTHSRILTKILSSFEDEIGSKELVRILNIYINSIDLTSTSQNASTSEHPITTITHSETIVESVPAPSPAPTSETYSKVETKVQYQPEPESESEDEAVRYWICGYCRCPPGGAGHRECIIYGYNCSVQAWEEDRIYPNKVKQENTDSTSVQENPIQSENTVPTTPPRNTIISENPNAPKKVKIERSGILEKPKKIPKPTKQCDARILGERSVIPNTKHTLAYKSAQCSSMTSHTVKLDDESVMSICNDCLAHYNDRKDNPKEWHGFFDDGNIPATSHIIGGSWYTKKVAEAAKKASKASKDKTGSGSDNE